MKINKIFESEIKLDDEQAELIKNSIKNNNLNLEKYITDIMEYILNIKVNIKISKINNYDIELILQIK